MNHLKLKLSLLINFFVLAILVNCVGTVALQAQRTYGITESTAGLLAVGKSAGIVIASVLAVTRLVRFGYRRAMLLSLGGLTIICSLLPAVVGFGTLAFLFAAVGASFAIIKVSVYATVGLITGNGRQHASFMNYLEAVFSIGLVFGYFLFGTFNDDRNPQLLVWMDVFYVIAVLSGLAWLLLYTSKVDDKAVDPKIPEISHPTLAGTWRSNLSAVVLTFGGCVFLYVMIEQSTMNWLPTFNSKVLHLSTGLSIQIASVLAISMALGRLLAGLALRRFSWFPLLIVCLLAAGGLVLFELALIDTPRVISIPFLSAPLAAFVLPMIGLFLGPVYPVLNSVVLSALPVERQGAMSGISVLFSALGSSIGTLALGYWFQIHGGQAALRITLVPIVVLLLALGLFYHQSTAAKIRLQSMP